MRRVYGLCLFIASILLTIPSFAQVKEIAITIDDLPFVGTTHNKPGNLRREKERFLRMMQSLIDEKVPATGFVIAGSIEKDQWALLEAFQTAGFTIGNHTYSHPNLNRTNQERYINDVVKADKILQPLMPEQKYFRYPYLAEGKGTTKENVKHFLTKHGYTVAPVTVDSKDFRFNAQLLSIHWRNRSKHLNSIKRQYLNYIWRQTVRAERLAKGKPVKQILLIHANLLNSHALSDIIKMYKERGYTFVPLSTALEKPETSDMFVSSIPPVPKTDEKKIF